MFIKTNGNANSCKIEALRAGWRGQALQKNGGRQGGSAGG